jgi:glyoxylase-like metal-dependent hydrolase (beta-lactamase superfamily II)
MKKEDEKMSASKVIFRVTLLVFSFTCCLFAQTIDEAALKGNLDKINELLTENPSLLKAGNELEYTPLHYACQGGHLETVEFLICKGADVNAANINGETPLHYAAYMGHTDVVKALMNNEAKINERNIQLNSPLHYAAYREKIGTMQSLLEGGADINAKNHNGYTPLDFAYANNCHESCDFLVSKGGTHINIEDPEILPLSKNVYRILFPFGDVSNIGVFKGHEEFLLVDTGFNRRAVDKLRTALKKLGDGKVKVIINTHLHNDHTAGNSIGGEDAVIIDFTNLDQMVANGVLSRAQKPITGGTGKTFDTWYTMTFNGEKVRLIPYAGIHSDTDLIVHFTRSGVVHMGDLLISQSFPSVAKKTDEYLEFLEKTTDIFPNTTKFICGHGRECTLEDVANYQAMLKETAEIVKKCLKEGKGRREIRKEKAFEAYESWNDFIPILNINYWIDAACNSYQGKM